jgi:hypothetical protein
MKELTSPQRHTKDPSTLSVHMCHPRFFSPFGWQGYSPRFFATLYSQIGIPIELKLAGFNRFH